MSFVLLLSFIYIIIFNLIIIFNSRLKITSFQSKVLFALFTVSLSAIAVGGIQYSELLTFNLLRWIVVAFFDDYIVMPLICVIIDYTIIGYIYIDWCEASSEKNKHSIIPLFVLFSFMPFVHCCSGMRNGLCACLLALGIYLYLYKNK